MMRIGVISDTHGLLRPEAVKQLAAVDHIIHAGDIGGPEVITGLEKIAPVVAIKGNNDVGEWAAGIPDDAVVTLGNRRIYVLHNVKDLGCDPATVGFDVVISGHSHRPMVEIKGGVLYLNPGSAGPRRFTLPIALAMLELTEDRIIPRICEIAV
jgi:putative phosphoesterase